MEEAVGSGLHRDSFTGEVIGRRDCIVESAIAFHVGPDLLGHLAKEHHE